MKTILSFFAAIFFTANAFPQTSAELTCRAQAKELAMQTYSNCITQTRNQQVDEIRKNYQKELSSLKTKYDNELKKIGGGKTGKTTRSTSAPTKEVIKTLPLKTITTETVSIPDSPNKAKVVAVDTVDTEESSDTSKSVTQEPEQVEIINMPIEENQGSH